MQSVGSDTRDEAGGALVASGVTTTVLGPFDFRNRPTKTFSIYNQSLLTLSGAVVQVNPDPHGHEQSDNVYGGGLRALPNEALWFTYNSTAFESIAAGATKGLVANDLFRWWRVVATNREATAITVSGWALAGTI